MTFFSAISFAQQAGGIRGMVHDADFDMPLANVQVMVVENGVTATGSSEGNFVISDIQPGTYTVIFSKDGYTRQVKSDVVVTSGQMAELDVWLAGDFTEMEDFVVQDVLIGTGTEAELLQIRLTSPALLDSISSELMSQAGASDAAGALNLIAGTTVQEGKYAVVRGLPDRYVNSQMNGVRLPTADADKRAVQLDQFPSSIIESIQVSKTFTPDQQGDASGGAVNVILKGVPEETTVQFSGQSGFNTNVKDAGDDFLSYEDGGLTLWGKDTTRRQVQPTPSDWDGAVGVSTTKEPMDYKWSLAGGGKQPFQDVSIGGFSSFYYERDSSYYDDGIDDRYWVESRGSPMKPYYTQGLPEGADSVFYTSLFDVIRASQEVKWGSLNTVGIENENHALSLLYMYTRDATDKATVAENIRGKHNLHTYWPYFYGPEFDNYDPYDLNHPGNGSDYRFSSPYRRFHTLEYTERTTQTVQLSGKHSIADVEFGIDDVMLFHNPVIDWTLSHSSSTLYQPDKRLFAATWYPTSTTIGRFIPFRPASSVNLGNLQRVWKDISEDSDQISTNLKLPFEQWSEDQGYLKFGFFHDIVKREYNQDSYTNTGAPTDYIAPWSDYWSDVFPSQTNYIFDIDIDVDYEGEQNITAWYYMADVPICSFFNFIGGARYETTKLEIINFPEGGVRWFPTDAGSADLRPGEADVDFKQDDILPSIGFNFTPWKPLIVRGSYSETVARQTFKELTPIRQQEYLGADLFIGNPDLQMSALKNYDIRLDYTPYSGGLMSFSYFYKDVKDPIEYVQKEGNSFVFTKPVNYPEGEISGIEVETRQQLGEFWKTLEGLAAGANATFIDSEVTLTKAEADRLKLRNFPEPKRDMSHAPEHLYNLFLTYDIRELGSNIGLFYTVRGDTLVAGSGIYSGYYLPSVYEKEYGTLNLSLSQKIGDIWTLKFQAKNLLNPEIQTVYRSDYIGSDVVKTSYTKGQEYSVSLSATF